MSGIRTLSEAPEGNHILNLNSLNISLTTLRSFILSPRYSGITMIGFFVTFRFFFVLLLELSMGRF